MRARSASISASGVTGIVNGRIAVAPADFSVVADIGGSLLRRFDYDTKPARLVSTPRRWKTLGLLPGLLPGGSAPWVLIGSSRGSAVRQAEVAVDARADNRTV